MKKGGETIFAKCGLVYYEAERLNDQTGVKDGMVRIKWESTREVVDIPVEHVKPLFEESPAKRSRKRTTRLLNEEEKTANKKCKVPEPLDKERVSGNNKQASSSSSPRGDDQNSVGEKSVMNLERDKKLAENNWGVSVHISGWEQSKASPSKDSQKTINSERKSLEPSSGNSQNLKATQEHSSIENSEEWSGSLVASGWGDRIFSENVGWEDVTHECAAKNSSTGKTGGWAECSSASGWKTRTLNEHASSKDSSQELATKKKSEASDQCQKKGPCWNTMQTSSSAEKAGGWAETSTASIWETEASSEKVEKVGWKDVIHAAKKSSTGKTGGWAECSSASGWKTRTLNKHASSKDCLQEWATKKKSKANEQRQQKDPCWNTMQTSSSAEKAGGWDETSTASVWGTEASSEKVKKVGRKDVTHECAAKKPSTGKTGGWVECLSASGWKTRTLNEHASSKYSSQEWATEKKSEASDQCQQKHPCWNTMQTSSSAEKAGGWAETSTASIWETEASSEKVENAGWENASHECAAKKSSTEKTGGWAESTAASGWITRVSSSKHSSQKKVLKKKNRFSDTSQQNAVSKGDLQVIQRSDDEFFLRYHFQERLVIKKIELRKSAPPIEDKFKHNKVNYILVCTKIEQKKFKRGSSFLYGDSEHAHDHVKCYYVASKSAKKVQKELNEIANFAALPTHKALSRLELLVSPASVYKAKEPRAWLQDPDLFQIIEENHNLGCGFIPRDLIHHLLKGSKRKDGRTTYAVQVRIICSSLGVFKGMLMAKEGIDKILLPKSMLKVDKSTSNGNAKAYLLFKNIFPSDPCQKTERRWKCFDGKPIQTENKKGLSQMQQKVLSAWGVPVGVLNSYSCETCQSVVGVADPTNAIPEGSVFIPQLATQLGELQKVFVTRFPCTEKGDGRLLPLLTTKPGRMCQRDWDFLNNLSYGSIIFGTPTTCDEPALPPTIADGDLDGDLYWICWDQAIAAFLNESSETETTPPILSTTILDNKTKEFREDLLLGEAVTIEIDGHERKGTVDHKNDVGKYVCKFGEYGDRILTSAEIMKDRDYVKEILKHQIKDRKQQVYVHWEISGEKSWKSVSDLRNEGYEEILEAYARAHDLESRPGWKWVQRKLRKPLVHKILKRRRIKNVLEVQIRWDDGSITWELVDNLKDDEDYQKDLSEYAKENSLLNSAGWMWAKHYLEHAKKNWFVNAQDLLSDTARLNMINSVIRAFHKAWKKSSNKNMLNDDTVILGRGFKKSLELAKHGGRVVVPFRLREKLGNLGDEIVREFIEYV